MEIEKLDNSETDTLDCYDIDTADVWNYERENLLFSEKNNHKIALTLINKLANIIVHRGISDFSQADYDNGNENFKRYYSSNIKKYVVCLKSLETQYEIEYFFDKNGNCYSYNQSIIISIGDPDYDFWFTLRLRQYDGKISEIEKYLNYHLENNFNKDTPKFLKFLKLYLRQYSENLSNKVTSTVQEWVENKTPLINPLNGDIQARRSNKSLVRDYVEYQSFNLKGVTDFKKHFESNGVILTGILSELRKDFFDDATTYQQFKDILSGEKIKLEKRICWKGSYKALQIFVRILNYDLEKIEPLKNGIWLLACSCFTKRNKKGEEIEIISSQLSKAKTSKNREEILEKILKKILEKL